MEDADAGGGSPGGLFGWEDEGVIVIVDAIYYIATGGGETSCRSISLPLERQT